MNLELTEKQFRRLLDLVSGQVLGQYLEKHVVFVFQDRFVDSPFHEGLGGNDLPLV